MSHDRNIRSHFHVTARELLFVEPEPCPYLPTLTMVGLAVTPTEQHHVILELQGTTMVDRFYAGPTQQDVERRAQILAAGLRTGRTGLAAHHAETVRQWVTTTWEATLDEIVDALTDYGAWA